MAALIDDLLDKIRGRVEMLIIDSGKLVQKKRGCL
jgi:hypothetical protein